MWLLVVLLLLHSHELLEAATSDGFRDVHVAVRIGPHGVPISELTCVVSGAGSDSTAAEAPEDGRAFLVDQPGVVASEVRVQDVLLARRALAGEIVNVGVEIYVAGPHGSRQDRCLI